MCEYLPGTREYCDTNLQFSFVVPQVSILFYFGILNNGFDRPNKRCRGYSLYVRLTFVLVKHQFSVLWQYSDNELDKHYHSDPRHRSHKSQRC